MFQKPSCLASLKSCHANGYNVSKLATGMRENLVPSTAMKTTKRNGSQVEQALIQALAALPLTLKGCSCQNALENARFT